MDKYWHLKLLYIIAKGIKQLKSYSRATRAL